MEAGEFYSRYFSNQDKSEVRALQPEKFIFGQNGFRVLSTGMGQGIITVRGSCFRKGVYQPVFHDQCQKVEALERPE